LGKFYYLSLSSARPRYLNMFDFKKLKKYRGRKAVSPVVATLILIIVAIVGAVAVGLIVSGIGTNTGKQANANNAASNAQDVVYVGGSTTVYPVTVQAVQPFETATGIQVQLSQGGSDAGMQGVLSGSLDIGESSSINAVHALYNSVTSNNILGITVQPTLIGGSGVVAITTSECGPVTIAVPATCATPATSNGATPLYDGTNACLELTRDAIAEMYVLGTFYIEKGACGAAAGVIGNEVNTLNSACVVASAATNTAALTCLVAAGTGAIGPFLASHRTDPGGTQDTYCGYLNNSPVANGTGKISYTPGQTGCGASTLQGIGNLGVLQSVQTCPAADQGCIAMVDLGFADGASAQAAATCSGTGSTPCKVFIPEVSSGACDTGAAESANCLSATPAEATIDPLTEATNPLAVSQSSYAYATDSIGNIHSFVKTALKYGGLENPFTLQWPTNPSTPATYFPDPSAGTVGQGALDRLLFLVINSQKDSANIDKFVTFLTQPSAEQYFVNAGYESQYDFTTA